ncbi:uncharacterized protein LOC144099464 isoform X5 [Amblyomma americanum]
MWPAGQRVLRFRKSQVSTGAHMVWRSHSAIWVFWPEQPACFLCWTSAVSRASFSRLTGVLRWGPAHLVSRRGAEC